MTKVSLDCQPYGFSALDDESADVCCAVAGTLRPFVVKDEAASYAAIEVFRLTDIQRTPLVRSSDVANDVHAGERVKPCANGVNFHLVSSSADARPND